MGKRAMQDGAAEVHGHQEDMAWSCCCTDPFPWTNKLVRGSGATWKTFACSYSACVSMLSSMVGERKRRINIISATAKLWSYD